MPSDGDRNGRGASRGKSFGTQTAQGRRGLLMKKELTGLEANTIGGARPQLWSLPAIPETGQRQGGSQAGPHPVTLPANPPCASRCHPKPSLGPALPFPSLAHCWCGSCITNTCRNITQALQALLAAGTCPGHFWEVTLLQKGPWTWHSVPGFT